MVWGCPMFLEVDVPVLSVRMFEGGSMRVRVERGEGADGLFERLMRAKGCLETFESIRLPGCGFLLYPPPLCRWFVENFHRGDAQFYFWVIPVIPMDAVNALMGGDEEEGSDE